jgi:antitoxin component YwqK of YwqJK toxin-antitoxin module
VKKGVLIPLVVGVVVFTACGVLFYDAIPGTLHFTDDGPRGTGTERYDYPTRALKLREVYFRGRLQTSEWYKPDGTLIQKTTWVDGDGEGLYLRNDGSIRSRMMYVHGIAEGKTTYYAPDGTVVGEAVFKDGSRVSGYNPQEDPNWVK